MRSTKFLGQFKGMTANDNFTIDDDNGLKSAGKDAVKASKAIANAVRKLLVVYNDFYGPKRAEIKENENK